MLKRMKKMLLLSIYSGLGLIILTHCTNDYPSSLFNPDAVLKPNPTISQMQPDFALAGVDQITIIGSNFSPIPGENIIYFNSVKATVISSEANKIIVKAPNIPLDSIKVKIAVEGAEVFSNVMLYNLSPAVKEAYPFEDYQAPYTIASDGLGTLYFSFLEENASKGIYQITADGVLSEFAPKGGETTFYDLKYHSDGYLIGVYGNKAIFKIEAGIRPAVFVNTGDNSIKLNSFDFDKNKTIWASGKGGKIVSVKPDKSFKIIEYGIDISSLRVFNDYLYAISGEALSQNIVRFPIISPDSLGAVQTVFNLSNNVDGETIANSITFSADGQMFIATSPSSNDSVSINPIMFVNTDGSFGTWYTDLISSSASSLTWGSGTNMFIIRDRYPNDINVDPVIQQNIIKLNMVKEGAPAYGRD